MSAEQSRPEGHPTQGRHARHARHRGHGRRGQDRVTLTGLRATGRHGVFPQEKLEGQEFVVDVELALDLAAAGASDDLADTVSYAEVADLVVARVTGPSVDLIERLATLVADDILDLDPRIRAVTVTVHKPQAPIPHDFDDAAVTIRRRRPWTRAVVALGANLGDRAQTLTAAVEELAGRPGVRVAAVSSLVESDAQVLAGQAAGPAYLNAVVLLDTGLTARELLEVLHEIEDEHGRTRAVRWGARTLDLDLVTFGELTIDDPELTLPHPRARERGFVLVPWAQVDPAACLDGEPVADLARSAADAVRSGPEWAPRLRRSRTGHGHGGPRRRRGGGSDRDADERTRGRDSW